MKFSNDIQDNYNKYHLIKHNYTSISLTNNYSNTDNKANYTNLSGEIKQPLLQQQIVSGWWLNQPIWKY